MTSTENNNSLAQTIDKLQFNTDGLIPTIAQDFESCEVLMMAWMNRDAVIETLSTGRVCYYSRSRQKLWRKGETSGQVQTLKNFRIDCDADTVLLLVEQNGVACHTGRRSCFFEELSADGSAKIIADVIKDPKELYRK
tara:strand:- start:14598 stop:15011 length:414 start_codon:yes stop_codon:yes gene_type:complete